MDYVGVFFPPSSGVAVETVPKGTGKSVFLNENNFNFQRSTISKLGSQIKGNEINVIFEIYNFS